jgi:hypothetical protein
MSDTIKEQLKQQAARKITGEDIMDIARFKDYTRHMIVYEIRSLNRGHIGERKRVFLTDEGYYRQALECEYQGEIRIIRHARVVKGELFYDTQEREK